MGRGNEINTVSVRVQQLEVLTAGPTQKGIYQDRVKICFWESKLTHTVQGLHLYTLAMVHVYVCKCIIFGGNPVTPNCDHPWFRNKPALVLL